MRGAKACAMAGAQAGHVHHKEVYKKRYTNSDKHWDSETSIEKLIVVGKTVTGVSVWGGRCTQPQWAAPLVNWGGPPLRATLLAAVFVLHGLNFGRTAVFAGDALASWASLAWQQMRINHQRCVPLHS